MKNTRVHMPIEEALTFGLLELHRLNREGNLGINIPDVASLTDGCPGHVLRDQVPVARYPDAWYLNACCLLQAVLAGAVQFRSTSDDHVVAAGESDIVARLTTIVGELLQECEDRELCDWSLVC